MRGVLTDRYQEILRPFIQDQTVHDLGAGDLSLAHALIDCGAAGVIAIDRDQMLEPLVPNIERMQAWFDQYKGDIDIAFMSWPVNWDSGILGLARRARIVIYLGRNTDGTTCGYPDLWWHLRTREVLAHVFEDPGTSFIVYGPGTRQGQGRLPEEHAALEQSHVWTFEELDQWWKDHPIKLGRMPK